MSLRVLVGCPTHRCKDYCLEAYAKAVKSLSYNGFDVLLVDNSPTDEYFEKINHTFVPSSPVVPKDDPTLMFANAGRILASRRIEHTIWGHDLPPYSRALAGLVSRMRRTLNLCAENGVTVSVVYAQGYRLD